MPVPLPRAGQVRLGPPDAAETQLVARGIASACATSDGLTATQALLIEALCRSMTGHDVDVAALEPLSARELAAGLRSRDVNFRSRILQLSLLCALTLRPLPRDVADRVASYAKELSVDDAMVAVAERFATGALGLAAFDFERNGYTSGWRAEDATELHASSALVSPWDVAVDDSELYARWRALGDLPPDTLGRRVWELYRARGFVFPGALGSAPPLLAQHDWVHVLADYGTTVEAELEVFAFIARANDDLRGFSLLAMVVSLFETGYLRSGAGLFQYDPGHLSGRRGMADRVADAMRRGALCHDRVAGNESVDFLRIDWFDLAHLPVDEARARFDVVPKAMRAVTAGSTGPWAPGGISEFQLRSGRELAAREDRLYDSFGATTS
jgi:hypothetical protein